MPTSPTHRTKKLQVVATWQVKTNRIFVVRFLTQMTPLAQFKTEKTAKKPGDPKVNKLCPFKRSQLIPRTNCVTIIISVMLQIR